MKTHKFVFHSGLAVVSVCGGGKKALSENLLSFFIAEWSNENESARRTGKKKGKHVMKAHLVELCCVQTESKLWGVCAVNVTGVQIVGSNRL